MPTMTPQVYGGELRAAMGGGVSGGRDFDTDSWKATLHTASYTFSYTHVFQSDLTNELSTAGGYTSGGLSLSSVALSVTAANSWGTSAATSTAYAVGQVVRPATGNGFIYQCVVAGTSGGSAPTWGSVVGRETTDGTVVWLNIGAAGIKFSCADLSWATFTAGPFRRLVIADTTPGSSAANPVIACLSFASDQTGGGGTFAVPIDTTAGLFTIGVA